jgi:1,4-dihydroxy-2-naphthoate octaprenyltransferase
MANKSKIVSWLEAFRLRTLPLSLSSILLGGALAYADGPFSWRTTLLAALTTLFLQILSNLANDYGDFSHGLDNEDRQGPSRTLQKGALTPRAMKRAILLFSFLSLLSGILLIRSGTRGLLSAEALLFLILGVLAIGAAIKYTVGKKPYGYYGLGDLFVFLFFGLAGVLGTYYLNTHRLPATLLLPASATGFLATGVLNLNNMRDREADRRHGKRTLAVLLGPRNSRIYQLTLLLLAVLFSLIYTLLHYHSPWQFIFLIIVPPLIRNLQITWSGRSPADLDPLLKKLALTTLLYALSFGAGMVI